MFHPPFFLGPLFVFLVLVPAVRLLRRAGYPGWLALLLLVPVVNIVFLWWLAFGRGPAGSDDCGARRGRCGPRGRDERGGDASGAGGSSGTSPVAVTDRAGTSVATLAA